MSSDSLPFAPQVDPFEFGWAYPFLNKNNCVNGVVRALLEGSTVVEWSNKERKLTGFTGGSMREVDTPQSVALSDVPERIKTAALEKIRKKLEEMNKTEAEITSAIAVLEGSAIDLTAEAPFMMSDDVPTWEHDGWRPNKLKAQNRANQIHAVAAALRRNPVLDGDVSWSTTVVRYVIGFIPSGTAISFSSSALSELPADVMADVYESLKSDLAKVQDRKKPYEDFVFELDGPAEHPETAAPLEGTAAAVDSVLD